MLYVAGLGLICGMAFVAFVLKKRTEKGTSTITLGR